MPPNTVEGGFVRSGEYPIAYKATTSRYAVYVDDGDLNILDAENLRASMWISYRDDVSPLVGALLAVFDYLYGDEPRDLTMAYRWANGVAAPPDAWVTGGASDSGGAKLGYELVVHVEVNTVTRRSPRERKAPSRTWESLSGPYRQRVLGAGRRRGMTERQVTEYYASGGNMGLLSGHSVTPRNPASADPLLHPDYVLRHSDFRSNLGVINSVVATIVKAGASATLGADAYLFMIPGNRGQGQSGGNLHGV